MVKEKVSVTVEKELLAWADQRVKDDIYFSDRSHLFQVAITEMRKRLEKVKEK